MKKIHFNLITLFFTSLIFTSSLSAQVLSAGDLAFTGYNATPNSPQSDAFSFVLLVNIPAGTVINFTDNGWLNTNVFRSGEQTVTWTSAAALVAGREITISGPPAGTPTAAIKQVVSDGGFPPSPGTCTGTMLSLSVNGDQVIAYQGTVASPTIISAIHMNVYIGGTDPSVTDATNWDGAANTTNSSAKPPTLTTGVNALWIGTTGISASERNNAVFNCTGPLATPAQVRVSVNNQSNWNSEFAGSGAVPSWIPPSGCTFLGVVPIPVKLMSFEGRKINSHTVSLDWEVTNQIDISNYVVEKSTNGISYKAVGTITATSKLDDKYSFEDKSAAAGKSFYRLKINEITGEVSYSKIVSVLFSAKSDILCYPNPVTDKLTIEQLTNTLSSNSASLHNSDGVFLRAIILNKKQVIIDMHSYAPGVYLLKMEDGIVFRVIKK